MRYDQETEDESAWEAFRARLAWEKDNPREALGQARALAVSLGEDNDRLKLKISQLQAQLSEYVEMEGILRTCGQAVDSIKVEPEITGGTFAP